MASNKTRICYYDNTTSQPHQVVMATEFDVYQDALDYVLTIATLLVSKAGDGAWWIELYSYENTSYSYTESGGALQKSVITFPASE